jgi:hypothetical protein
MQKLKAALSNLTYKSCLNHVEYLDLSRHTGEKSLFQKDVQYSWQEELRLIIHTDKHKMYDPFEFSIGNIEEISEIIDLQNTPAIEYKLG